METEAINIGIKFISILAFMLAVTLAPALAYLANMVFQLWYWKYRLLRVKLNNRYLKYRISVETKRHLRLKSAIERHRHGD